MNGTFTAEMQRQQMKIRPEVRGAIAGIEVWLIYGILESTLTALTPWLWPSHAAAGQQRLAFIALLFVAYGLVGLLLGGVCGLTTSWLCRRSRLLAKSSLDPLLTTGAVLTVLFVLVLNIAFSYPFELSSKAVLAVCLAIGAVAVARAVWHKRPIWLEPVANPWSAIAIGLGTAWLIMEVLRSHEARLLKAGVVVGYPLCVGGISIVGHSIKARFDSFAEWQPYRRLRFVLPLSALSIVGAYWAYGPRQPIELDAKVTVAAASGPNIVLIILDTVRADHMSLYGYERETTPNIDEFAGEATVYAQAVAASDMTLASHASIFTGLYARTHGARHAPPENRTGLALRDEFETVAEFLGEMGYATLGVLANHAYLGREWNLNQGFQYWDDRIGGPLLVPAQDLFARQRVFELLAATMSLAATDEEFRRASEINKEVFKKLDELTDGDTPFFLVVNYMDAHWPYLRRTQVDEFAPTRSQPFGNEDYFSLRRRVLTGQQTVPVSLTKSLMSLYDSELVYLDNQVDALLERLKTDGIYENTLIVITSDHGEAFGRRNLIGHGVSVYQDQVHVPLIVKWPHSRSGSTVEEVVSHVDIFPTIAELLRRETSTQLSGKSLAKLRAGEERSVFSESYAGWLNRVERALFKGNEKLIVSSTGKRELYALGHDPFERLDLITADSTTGALLEGVLAKWLAKSPDFLQTNDAGGETIDIDERTLDRLRRLGYIQ